MTTKAEIREWLAKAPDCATHMLVMCDTFDHDDYPVYFNNVAQAQKRADKPDLMERFMECYRLDMDHEQQLAQSRARNF
jgi:hypothetical protein